MIKRSCEDRNTIYVCLPFIRLVFRDRKYVGWYRPWVTHYILNRLAKTVKNGTHVVTQNVLNTSNGAKNRRKAESKAYQVYKNESETSVYQLLTIEKNKRRRNK